MNLEEYLKQLGLEEHEIVVYLALLELGESKIVPIAKKADLPRTTVFYILERLEDFNLIEIIEKNTRRTYQARPPRTILTLLNNQKEEINEQIDTFTRSLSEIDRVYRVSAFQPMVRFFQRKEIRLIYEEMLEISDPNKGDAIWGVSGTKQIVDAFGAEYTERWIDRRIAKKLPSRFIRVKSEELEDVNAPRPNDYRSYRWAPKGFKCPSHILIYKDNVAIITTSKESFGTVITSKEYTETMRSWFEELWKVSEPVK